MTSYRRRKLARVALDALRIEYRRIARSGKYRDVERRRFLREMAKGLAA
jgi:hypothetical protein